MKTPKKNFELRKLVKKINQLILILMLKAKTKSNVEYKNVSLLSFKSLDNLCIL